MVDQGAQEVLKAGKSADENQAIKAVEESEFPENGRLEG